MITMDDIKNQVARLETVAKAGDDTGPIRELLLSSVALLVEQVQDTRDAAAAKIIEEYRTLAQRARLGHA